MPAEPIDIAIVGAGPAGSAAAVAALRAGPGLRVALIDRCTFPRDKACGDGVAPHVLDLLAALGEPDLLDGVHRVAELDVGFAGAAGARARRRMVRPALVVPRLELDARLVGVAVRRGGVLHRGRVRSVRQSPRGVALAGEGPVLDGGLLARVVIGADGAHSAVASSLAAGDGTAGGRRVATRPTGIALRGYAPVGPGRDGVQVITFPSRAAPGAGWPAYAWSFPIGGGLANVGYGELLREGSGPTRVSLLARLEELLPGAGAGGRDWRAHHLPLSTGRRRQPDGPVLLAGDALRLVHPLTGEGIHAAVLSGALAGVAAAGAVAAGWPSAAGIAYRRALRARMGRHLRHAGVAARLGRFPAVVAAGVRGSAAHQAVFDDLVDFGLADGGLTGRLLASLALGGR